MSQTRSPENDLICLTENDNQNDSIMIQSPFNRRDTVILFSHSTTSYHCLLFISRTLLR